ncbi:MAG: hypothetical protein M1827_005825 [Pycnora praestabilis]|nr:MAG: hypothetical protein M1827_005825 [Pycnora praestabilis]
MVIDFHVGDKENASFYAGILISAFALSESLTGMFWGSLSDRIGRKPVLLLGCAGTLASLLVVGFSTNFWIALAGRALGGFLNGNIGVIQTMVGELVTKPEHEPRAYAVMPFVWSIGTIIGPAIGGTFANPAMSFPSIFSPTSIFSRYPFLLPNVICALMLLVSIVAGYFLLEETHPDLQPWSSPTDHENTSAETPLLATAGATEHAPVDLRSDAYGTFNAVDITEEEQWLVVSDGSAPPAPITFQPSSSKTFTKRVIMLVIALGIFTYHSMTYDHLLPIFLQDERVDDISASGNSALDIPGGLGMTTQKVGIIMSFNGLIALLIQAIVFPLFAQWLGVWKTFLVVTIFHPIAYFIVPYLVLLPSNWLYPGIYFCLTIRNLFSILAYPVILIMLKEAAPRASALGKINGLAASVGAACRTVGPPVAGLLYGIGAKQGFTGLAWWGSGVVAIAGAIQCWFVVREKRKTAHVHSVAAYVTEEPKDQKAEIVHIIVDHLDQV